MSSSKSMVFLLVGTFLSILAASNADAAPFPGTIFLDSDIITATDHSSFTGVSYVGQSDRVMFDRRTDSFETYNAYLFQASFSDGLSSEIQVNPEFGDVGTARDFANFYGAEIGRLPTLLRSDVDEVWIHRGVELFGGGNNSLLIHTGQGELYIADEILEETFFHEAVHTSLDAIHAQAAEWLAAQAADAGFISDYAQSFPSSEDIAESLLPYFAVRYRSDRISTSDRDTIVSTIPNRIAYFDDQSFNLLPHAVPEPGTFSLLALSLLGLVLARRNRSKI